MPTWGDLLKEIYRDNKAYFDEVRRKYLIELFQYTKRPVILYTTRWTDPPPNASPNLFIISDDDLTGLMNAMQGIEGDQLDIIIHSPGGSIEATEALVEYLRSRFSNIRAIVPQFAMSAATMICCASNRIVMGKHSFLGPIDPQFILNTQLGQRSVTAQNVIDQFTKARNECRDTTKLGAWMPMLGQFGPDLLIKCDHANRLSRKLVREWLQKYMTFKPRIDRRKQSSRIAIWLSTHKTFRTHGRHLGRKLLESKGFDILHLERDQKLQELVLSVFHSATHSMNSLNGVCKIIENHLGKAYIKSSAVVQNPLTVQKKSS